MIELIQHIEFLLLENDCVIIPGFGGFITYNTSAIRLDGADLFLSPTRTIGFNPQLKLNDGLLVQSYMTVYDTNFSDATKIVKEQVDTLIAFLHNEGKVDFGEIGEIRCVMDGTYEFVPCNGKIVTPYLYGLDSYEMKELSALHQEEKRVLTSVVHNQKKSYELRINRAFIRNMVAAVAAIALFFFLSTPVENTNIEKDNYASLLPANLFEKIEKQSLAVNSVVIQKKQNKEQRSKKTIAIKPVVVKEVKVVNPIVTKPNELSASIQAKVDLQPKQSEDQFHIIVASGIAIKGAEALAKQLIASGYKDAKVLKSDAKVRVSIISCSSREEATKQLLKIRENEAYKNAWMLAR